VPGEPTLIGAALYAGTTHELDIVAVVAAAAAGAILGDNVGFWLGREFGYRLLLRYRGRLGMTERKIKLGQYLFLRHSGRVVFWGRFVAVLRVLAAFLAGANRMNWRHFLLCNAAGGVVWAAIYGFGAYYLGREIHQLTPPIRLSALAVPIGMIVALALAFRRNKARWEVEAERALPGPAPARTRLNGRRRGPLRERGNGDADAS
jgi:membrane protein DedA with SNARE-associated domain